ncbi:MAG TPA: hypothetical protein VHL53_16815 [Acidimicrobiia bacterium]|nr:hypothetical protein [Acidimicrobiia bacterium]
MRRPVLSFLSLLVLVVLPAAGCNGGGGSKTAQTSPSLSPSSTAAAQTPPSVTVTARDYGFDVPSEIEGGVVRLTLRNTGQHTHEAVIVEAGATPLDRLRADLTPIVESAGKATPGYLKFRGGVSLVRAGTSSSATVTLPPGQYVMVCTLTDADTLDTANQPDEAAPAPDAPTFHFNQGMAVPFTVRTANTAVMPPTDGAFVAHDWSYDLPALKPGTRTYTFRNDGAQDHTLAVAEFGEGIDEAAARSVFGQFLAAQATGKEPPDALPTPDDIAFAGPLSAGGAATFTVELKPNRTYVFACYLSDRTGGPVHAIAKNMVAYATTPAG